MDETKTIWMDGKLVPWKEAKIHVLTHSLHYGGAVFEGIRFYETVKGPAVFRLKEHIDRLFYSASVFSMKIPFSKKELTKAVLDTIRDNGVKAGYIRPLVYFGYGKMGLSLKGTIVNVSIAVWPWGAYLGDKPVKVGISSIMRVHPKTTDPSAKICGNYQNSILAGEEARAKGHDEALLLDYEGNVAEGPGENIFIVKDKKLITPVKGCILPGITRDSIMTLARDEGLVVEEKQLRPNDVYEADEAFFTGTAAEVTPIGFVDGKAIRLAPGPVTNRLKSLYADVVRGKVQKYSAWLSLA